MAAAGMDGRPS